MKILVIYSSKYGSTAEVADIIARAIQDAGSAVDVLAVNQSAEPNDYDAVFLGSPLYAGHWRGDAVKWLTKHSAALKQKQVVFFCVGMSDESDIVTIAKAWQKHKELLNPVAEGYFTGRMDVQRLDFFSRMICKIMKANTEDKIDKEKISAWTSAVLAKLSKM